MSDQPFRKLRTPLLLWVFLIIPISFMAIGCQKKQAGGGQMPAFAMNVVGAKSRQQAVEEKLNLVSTLEANEAVEIKSEIDGQLEELSFQEGQEVKAGDVLFRIDSKKLKAELNEVEAKLKLAESTAQRYEQLVKTLAVSKQEYDRVMADLGTAQAANELSKEQFSDAAIAAPFDGIMGNRLVSVGQFISKGTSLSFLVDIDPVKATFYLPERYLAQIAVNQSVSLEVAAYPDKIFTGKVYFIDPKIDEQTRTALVKAEIPNGDKILRPGMFANLQLIFNVRKNAIVVPELSILIDADRTSVYVIDEGNIAHLRAVKTGIRFDGMVEITEGLRAGEAVVTEGLQKLREGASVNLSLSTDEN